MPFSCRELAAVLFLTMGCIGGADHADSDVLVDTALSFDLGPEDTGDSAPRFDEDVEADSDHIGGDAAVDVGIDVRLDSGDDPDLALGTLIGPDGGVLDFEFARVIIPPGALEEPVRIALVVDGVGIADCFFE